MRRAVLVGLAMVTFAGGCGAARGGEGARSAPPATEGAPALVYQPPADPCAAVPAAVARRFKLEKPERRTYDLFATDDQRPADPLVSFGQLNCFWTVENPAQGPTGRPNAMTARVAYSVLTPDRPNAADIAAEVFTAEREELRKRDGVTVVREGEPRVECEEGYDAFVHEESPTGAGGEVEVTVRRANAVVTVSFGGADLTLDRSKPRGLQLVTRPVDERRLRPVVEGILPGALDLLKQAPR